MQTATDVTAALGRERQAQLLGCTETGCMAELGQAMGARYLVSGRLDEVGDQFVLVSSILARAHPGDDVMGSLTGSLPR